MVQAEFKELVFEFDRKVSELDNVRHIFLFGSVAREQADKRSDVDLCVIIDDVNKKGISKIALDLEKKYDKNIQLVISRNFSKLDKYFVDKLLEEGVLLFSKDPSIKLKDVKFEVFLLISYSLRNLAHKDKMKIKARFYGYSTKKMVNRKVYKSSYEGLIKQLNGLSVGAGAVLVPLRSAQPIISILDSFNVKYTKIKLLREIS